MSMVRGPRSEVRGHGASARAFTLIEILVSTALILVLVTAATVAFNQAITMMRRIQAVKTLDAQAKALFDRLHRSFSALHPGAAVWLRARTSPATVELLFMRGKEENDDFLDPFNTGHPTTDYVWSLWRWTRKREVLEGSSSSPYRSFAMEGRHPWWNKTWKDGEYGSRFYHFGMVPELRRSAWHAPSAAFAPAPILDADAWGTGLGRDIGDYKDLEWRLTPALTACRDLTCELVLADGSTVTADGAADLDWGASGAFVDGGVAGRIQAATATRPCLVRLRFTLDDAATGATSTYCFSFATPGFVKP